MDGEKESFHFSEPCSSQIVSVCGAVCVCVCVCVRARARVGGGFNAHKTPNFGVCMRQKNAPLLKKN